MKVSYNWLQTFFDEPLPSAIELEKLLTFHAFEIEGVEEVNGDWVIDVDILPNRSSDCLSHRGIARELSTLLARPMKSDPLREPIQTMPTTDQLTVEVDDAHLCPRYIGAVVRNVKIGPSPAWLKKALETLGQKPINNVVDITNFVMLNIGQPLHVFDKEKLADKDGVQAIRVRAAKHGESITTLSGETYKLDVTHQLITDGISGNALALAGIKGGRHAEVTDATVDVVLEAATFQYENVRKTSKALKLGTDASLRFQNEPSPLLPLFGIRDAVALIKEIAGGELVGMAEQYEEARERPTVRVELQEVNRTLGVSLTLDDVEKILVRFDVEFSQAEGVFAVTSPWERTDLNIKEDVIEEIGRVYGYGTLTAIVPGVPRKAPHINKRLYYFDSIREFLAERGYSEVYTYTLRDKGDVELTNPLAADKAFLRRDLSTGMYEALERNARVAPLVGVDTVKLFTIDSVFPEEGEHFSLAIGVVKTSGKQSKVQALLEQDVVALEQMLGVPLAMSVKDGVAEYNIDAVLGTLPEPHAYHTALEWNPSVRYQPISSYPFALRDIALWVPTGTPLEEVEAVIVATASELLVRHDMFDEFEKEGRTSYAWHLVFQSDARTLTDGEVNKEMDHIVAALTKRSWEVR